MPAINGKGVSAMTGEKQLCLNAISGRILGMWSALGWARPIVIDCTAGDGQPHGGHEASPVILSRHCTGLGFPFFAIEKDFERHSLLCQTLNRSTSIMNCDMVDGLNSIHAEHGNTLGGLIYIDPNGTIPDADALGKAISKFERADILINITATAIKRNQGRLQDVIEAMNKPEWYIRPPIGAWQWTMLVGTRSAGIKPIDGIGFTSIKTQKGKGAFEKANHTANEIRELHPVSQSSFFSSFGCFCQSESLRLL